ncbi:MAG: peptidase inhibitor family I36 protein [Actinoplanes sp.]
MRKKITVFLSALALSIGAFVGLGASPALAAYSNCPTEHVCFWTGNDGTGSMCSWSAADPDWTGGSITCSWAATNNVKSVYNRGTASDLEGVVYYSGADYNTRKGCTRQGQRGNLAGTYKVRSHKWTDGNCG